MFWGVYFWGITLDDEKKYCGFLRVILVVLVGLIFGVVFVGELVVLLLFAMVLGEVGCRRLAVFFVPLLMVGVRLWVLIWWLKILIDLVVGY